MRNYSTITSPQVKPVAILSQVLAALVAGSIIFMALAVAVIVGYGAYNAGQIYPGVSVAGIDLSGMKPEEAAVVLENRISYPSQGRILLKEGEKIWLASPADLGFYLDPQSSARAAYQYGRRGGPIARLANQVTAWYYGASLPPLYLFDERATYEYLQGIAQQVDLPTIDASLSIDGVNVVVRPGQVGRLPVELAVAIEQRSDRIDIGFGRAADGGHAHAPSVRRASSSAWCSCCSRATSSSRLPVSTFGRS